MDYLGWELERQRAALWALLGGGKPDEDDEDHSVREGKPSPDGTRRSPAAPEAARGRGTARAGRYAEGREKAGGPLMGAPGAWEIIREAERAPSVGGAEGREPPEGMEFSDGEIRFPAQETWSAETGAAAIPWRKPAEEVRNTPRLGTGGAAKPRTSSGGPEEGGADRAAPEGLAVETAWAAEAAGEGGAEKFFPGGNSAVEAGWDPRSGVRLYVGEAAGDGSAAAADRRGRMLRTLPWDGRESAVLQAEAGAKALSRAVQRDARRYDGGFTIY